MILFVTALQIEAKPLIDYYALKKDMSEHKWPVYSNDEYELIISGTGKIKAAMAAVHLVSRNRNSEYGALINFGLCGSNSGSYELGTMLIAHKVQDMDTGRDYFPDIFIGKDIPRVSLQCHPRPVTRQISEGGAAIFCDMESAGIMEVTGKYLSAHQAVILKIISDHLDRPRLEESKIDKYLTLALPKLDGLLSELLDLTQPLADDVGKVEMVTQATRLLNLSVSLRRQLEDEARRAILNNKNLTAVTCILPAEPVKTKAERKAYFDRIMHELKK